MDNSPLEDVDRHSFSPPPFWIEPFSLAQKLASVAQTLHIEHIQVQYEHLLVLHDFHVHLMKVTQDQQLFESYRDIVSSIRTLMNRYEELLAKLQSR